MVPISLEPTTDHRKRSLSQMLLLAFSNELDGAGEFKCLFARSFLCARDRAQLHVQVAYPAGITQGPTGVTLPAPLKLQCNPIVNHCPHICQTCNFCSHCTARAVWHRRPGASKLAQCEHTTNDRMSLGFLSL